MRAYLDNVAASGRILGDLEVEMKALQEIERAQSSKKVKLVTSRESWREQERTRDPERRTRLEASRDEVSAVANDHVVLGFSNVMGPYGTVAANPIVSDVVDDALFADLKKIGLRDADARHLMYAVVNTCDRFVTLDRDFLDRREALEARCQTIRIVKPSELAAELR